MGRGDVSKNTNYRKQVHQKYFDTEAKLVT